MISATRHVTWLAFVLAACGGSSDPATPDAAPGRIDAPPGDGSGSGSGADGGPTTDDEQAAADAFDAASSDPDALRAFLVAMPKGGDLHNHLTGAVYAETYLDWARADGDCINSTTYASVYSNQCSASTQAVPAAGTTFYDAIVRAWSMKDFVPGAQTGHDHFFATFAKYGAVAGAHRNEDLADVLTRAASEHELYVETMFNLGTNVGSLSGNIWSGTLTAANLPALYSQLMASSSFQSSLASDLASVGSARSGYLNALGCNSVTPPDACSVQVRFIAQVSRTGANDVVFGQLVSAFEMAAQSPWIVGANLSSPEDDSASIANYQLHMAMLDFLYDKYTAQGTSPLHISLHAGELTSAVIPAGSNANTFHIRQAVEIAHAERIGHGVDIQSETDPDGLMDEMRDRGVLVETCLSSNAQILEVAGTAHPLAQYLAHGVPVALATDDQGVSRSSMAGEYVRAATDQHLTYRQLKRVGRESLEHSFLPGASLWVAIGTAQSVSQCPLHQAPSAACTAFLESSEKAAMQWKLEENYDAFEHTF